ncbi:MAG TPA: hypothetical protein VL461_02155 [Dictyobacter sp.]|jgi:hypothetical protein|nr:hypothetical protein [Dictyobacter sp.]
MFAHLYGFNWNSYSEQVMPAFAQWLLKNDETVMQSLFQQTRCAREELFISPILQHIQTWPRAQAFVKKLSIGPHTRSEYQLLCSAEQFTDLSDQYIHHHPPQFYPNSDILRVIWNAVVEEHCQIQLLPASTPLSLPPEDTPAQSPDVGINHQEFMNLLKAAGLEALALEINEQSNIEDNHLDEDLEQTATMTQNQGITIGHHPATLQLRGWLASISIRAMALFELLTCGRRVLPFGTRIGEPYESYIGYLTPNEVWQLATSLQYATAPDAALAENDYILFRIQKKQTAQQFRMIDEVLPSHAARFLQIVHTASQYKSGLLCSMF